MLFHNNKYPQRPSLLGLKQEEHLPIVIVGCIGACFLRGSGIWGGLFLFILWFLFACYNTQREWEKQCDIGFPSWQEEYKYLQSLGYCTDYGKGTHQVVYIDEIDKEKYEELERKRFRSNLYQMDKAKERNFFRLLDNFPQIKDELFEIMEWGIEYVEAFDKYKSRTCPEYVKISKLSNDLYEKVYKEIAEATGSLLVPPEISSLSHWESGYYKGIIAMKADYERLFYNKNIKVLH